MMTFEIVCPFCGKTSTIDLTEQEYSALQAGALVQEACPTRSADERELLISGICLDCQAGIFGSGEDDEPDFDECGFDPYLGCYTDDC